VYGAGALEDDKEEALPMTSGERSNELESFAIVGVYSTSVVEDSIADAAPFTLPRRAANALGLEAEARSCCCTGMLACKRVFVCVERLSERFLDMFAEGQGVSRQSERLRAIEAAGWAEQVLVQRNSRSD
jgi:hypothetical protein